MLNLSRERKKLRDSAKASGHAARSFLEENLNFLCGCCFLTTPRRNKIVATYAWYFLQNNKVLPIILEKAVEPQSTENTEKKHIVACIRALTKKVNTASATTD
jgi:hypothetical protein